MQPAECFVNSLYQNSDFYEQLKKLEYITCDCTLVKYVVLSK